VSERTEWEVLVSSTIAELTAGATAVSLYGVAHPRAAQTVEALSGDLGTLLASEPEIAVVLIGEELFVQGRPFTRIARQAATLVRKLRRRGLGQIAFVRGVTPDEIRQFLIDLSAGTDSRLAGSPHIRMGRIELSDAAEGGPDDVAEGRGQLRLPAVRDRIELLHETFSGFARGRPLAASVLDRIVRAIFRALEDQANPVRLLAPWQGEERWAAVHANNVATLAIGLARLAGVGQDGCLDLGTAGLTHDIGKLFFSQELLERDVNVVGADLELILDHPSAGLEVLLAAEQLTPLAAIVAYEHHLNFNGTGYPRLVRPRRPHPATRLVSAADVFDVLLTSRGGRGLLSREATLAWLADSAGSTLDPVWAGATATLLRVA
jgi:hypothetical protein